MKALLAIALFFSASNALALSFPDESLANSALKSYNCEEVSSTYDSATFENPTYESTRNCANLDNGKKVVAVVKYEITEFGSKCAGIKAISVDMKNAAN